VAFTSREIPAPPSQVFDVLVDPTTYPEWLIGTSSIREVDESWPAPGSRFHHRIGLGPFAIPDATRLIAVERNESLVLEVRVRPLILAVVTFRVTGNTDRSVVTMEEEPKLRFIGNLVRPLLDPVIHVRNHRSLRRLFLLFERPAA